VLGQRGVILNGSTAVYDLVHEQVHTATDYSPLVIPEEAVVVPGSRARSPILPGNVWNLSLYTPIIVKYRDAENERARPVGKPLSLKLPPHQELASMDWIRLQALVEPVILR